jgi:hypothetical protein
MPAQAFQHDVYQGPFPPQGFVQDQQPMAQDYNMSQWGGGPGVQVPPQLWQQFSDWHNMIQTQAAQPPQQFQPAQSDPNLNQQVEDCHFWLENKCLMGNTCIYRHHPRMQGMAFDTKAYHETPVCREFQTKGACPRDWCRYRHVRGVRLARASVVKPKVEAPMSNVSLAFLEDATEPEDVAASTTEVTASVEEGLHHSRSRSRSHSPMPAVMVATPSIPIPAVPSPITSVDWSTQSTRSMKEVAADWSPKATSTVPTMLPTVAPQVETVVPVPTVPTFEHEVPVPTAEQDASVEQELPLRPTSALSHSSEGVVATETTAPTATTSTPSSAASSRASSISPPPAPSAALGKPKLLWSEMNDEPVAPKPKFVGSWSKLPGLLAAATKPSGATARPQTVPTVSTRSQMVPKSTTQSSSLFAKSSKRGAR